MASEKLYLLPDGELARTSVSSISVDMASAPREALSCQASLLRCGSKTALINVVPECSPRIPGGADNSSTDSMIAHAYWAELIKGVAMRMRAHA